MNQKEATLAPPEIRPLAQTASGPVLGISRNGALAFLGLRYGAHTGGENRFRPPQEPTPWSEPQDASTVGPSAPQLPRPENTDPFYSWYSAIGRTDEDCLFLNLYTPALDRRPRPVMVWIHGGGWREFSGNAPGFDGSRLARAEDVVVVSLNHRLGVFGFLALPDDEEAFADSANAGLLDLVQAMRWVARNVASFGGDPGNVTLFGESGGASKVAALTTMPAARDLFHRAILQSSGGGLELATTAEAESHARRFKAHLGDETLRGRDLQKLTTTRILEAFRQAPGAFRGTIDGRHLFGHPLLPANGRPPESVGKPMMVGFTATEASYYFKTHPEALDVDLATATRRLAAFLDVDPQQAASILARFGSAYPALSPGELLVRITTDYFFTRNNVELASRQTQAPGPVYLYRFDYTTAIEGGRWGAPHTSELPYVFGTTEAAAGMIGHDPGHAEMSRTMMRIWAEFARSGDPGRAVTAEWRRFTPDERVIMRLDLEPRASVLPPDGPLGALDALPYAGYRNNRAALFAG